MSGNQTKVPRAQPRRKKGVNEQVKRTEESIDDVTLLSLKLSDDLSQLPSLTAAGRSVSVAGQPTPPLDQDTLRAYRNIIRMNKVRAGGSLDGRTVGPTVRPGSNPLPERLAASSSLPLTKSTSTNELSVRSPKEKSPEKKEILVTDRSGKKVTITPPPSGEGIQPSFTFVKGVGRVEVQTGGLGQARLQTHMDPKDEVCRDEPSATSVIGERNVFYWGCYP
jgi:hypothetical protein